MILKYLSVNLNQMSGMPDNLINNLKVFGLSTEEAELYILLIKKGALTALNISRDLKIARTKVYRLLEKLKEKGFVVEEIQSYGSKFKAESYERFNAIIKDKEEELKHIKNHSAELFNTLASLQSVDNQNSKILYYKGVEGLKQVTWNSLKAKNILRIFEIKDMSGFLSFDFAEKVRQELVERKIMTHQLTNLPKIEGYSENTTHVTKFWTPRYINPEFLNIDFEILIYNDVYCMYNYKDDDIFIVEIYNEKLARMQKKIFDFVWSQSLPMQILNNKGEAAIKSVRA